MRGNVMSKRVSIICVLVLAFGLSVLAAQTPADKAENAGSGIGMKAFAALAPIDTHTHVAKGDPEFYAMLDRLNLHVLDILLVDDTDPYRKDLTRERQDAETVIAASQGHVSLCTSIDPFKFDDQDFSAAAIRGLNQDFAKGAIAVKIWKNIGMELKDKDGRYVLPDDPKFAPIYRDIASHNRTLIAHLAEPDEAWEAPHPNGLDSGYYKRHPRWYMYNKPGVPAKQQILDARDHILAQNPKLRVVGAHLGSMEDDLDGLGKRLDRYPNFAVDTAARVVHLAVMPSDRVRSFILKYQDRIVYGTDLGYSSQAPSGDTISGDTIKDWEEQYARDWRYFATHDKFEYEGHPTRGLGLPLPVLHKLYHANAMHWFPGIIAKAAD